MWSSAGHAFVSKLLGKQQNKIVIQTKLKPSEGQKVSNQALLTRAALRKNKNCLEQNNYRYKLKKDIHVLSWFKG